MPNPVVDKEFFEGGRKGLEIDMMSNNPERYGIITEKENEWMYMQQLTDKVKENNPFDIGNDQKKFLEYLKKFDGLEGGALEVLNNGSDEQKIKNLVNGIANFYVEKGQMNDKERADFAKNFSEIVGRDFKEDKWLKKSIEAAKKKSAQNDLSNVMRDAAPIEEPKIADSPETSIPGSVDNTASNTATSSRGAASVMSPKDISEFSFGTTKKESEFGLENSNKSPEMVSFIVDARYQGSGPSRRAEDVADLVDLIETVTKSKPAIVSDANGLRSINGKIKECQTFDRSQVDAPQDSSVISFQSGSIGKNDFSFENNNLSKKEIGIRIQKEYADLIIEEMGKRGFSNIREVNKNQELDRKQSYNPDAVQEFQETDKDNVDDKKVEKSDTNKEPLLPRSEEVKGRPDQNFAKDSFSDAITGPTKGQGSGRGY